MYEARSTNAGKKLPKPEKWLLKPETMLPCYSTTKFSDLKLL